MENTSSTPYGTSSAQSGPWGDVRWELLGFAFHPTWIYLLLYGSGDIAQSLRGGAAGGPADPYDAVYYASVVALALTMLAGLVATKRFMRLALTPALAVGAPLLAAVGTLLYVANALSPAAGFVVAGGVLTGFGSGLLAARWAALFGRYNLNALMANFALLLLLIVALCLSTGYLPREAQLVLLICLPLLSGGCLLAAERQTPGRRSSDEREAAVNRRSESPRTLGRRFALLMAGVAVMGATAALLGAFTDNDRRFDFGGWFYLIATVLALSVAALSVKREPRQRLLALFVVPVAALIVLLLPQMRLATNFMASVIYPIGAIVFELLLLYAAILFAQRYDYSPARCFMAARLSFALSDLVGTLVGGALLAHSDSLAIAYLASLLLMAGSEALIAAVAAAAFLGRHRPEATAAATGSFPADNLSPAASANDSGALTGTPTAAVPDTASETIPLTPHEAIVRRCEALREQFGLSEREGEVLVLIAEGRSSARIQEDLVIAAGTVNYHTRNIYAKLGTHSRQEVIDLVLGSESAAN